MGNKKEAEEVLRLFFNGLKNNESVCHSDNTGKYMLVSGQTQTALYRRLGKQQGYLVKNVNVALPKMTLLCDNPRPFCNWKKFTRFMKSEFPDIIPDKRTRQESESSPQAPVFQNLRTFLNDIEKAAPQVRPFLPLLLLPGRQTALYRCWGYTRGWLIFTGHGYVEKKPRVDPSWIQLGTSPQEIVSLFVFTKFLHKNYPDLLLVPSLTAIINAPNDPCDNGFPLTFSDVDDDGNSVSPRESDKNNRKKRKRRTKSELGYWPLKTPYNHKMTGINIDELSPDDTMCSLCTTVRHKSLSKCPMCTWSKELLNLRQSTRSPAAFLSSPVALLRFSHLPWFRCASVMSHLTSLSPTLTLKFLFVTNRGLKPKRRTMLCVLLYWGDGHQGQRRRTWRTLNSGIPCPRQSCPNQKNCI